MYEKQVSQTKTIRGEDNRLVVDTEQLITKAEKKLATRRPDGAAIKCTYYAKKKCARRETRGEMNKRKQHHVRSRAQTRRESVEMRVIEEAYRERELVAALWDIGYEMSKGRLDSRSRQLSGGKPKLRL